MTRPRYTVRKMQDGAWGLCAPGRAGGRRVVGTSLNRRLVCELAWELNRLVGTPGVTVTNIKEVRR